MYNSATQLRALEICCEKSSTLIHSALLQDFSPILAVIIVTCIEWRVMYMEYGVYTKRFR